MPVTYGTYTKQLKLLPLLLEQDGTATLTVRFGYVSDDQEFTESTASAYKFSQEEVQSILDAEPTPGMTRRDDLSFALYQYLVQSGKIPPGSIS